MAVVHFGNKKIFSTDKKLQLFREITVLFFFLFFFTGKTAKRTNIKEHHLRPSQPGADLQAVVVDPTATTPPWTGILPGTEAHGAGAPHLAIIANGYPAASARETTTSAAGGTAPPAPSTATGTRRNGTGPRPEATAAAADRDQGAGHVSVGTNATTVHTMTLPKNLLTLATRVGANTEGSGPRPALDPLYRAPVNPKETLGDPMPMTIGEGDVNLSLCLE